MVTGVWESGGWSGIGCADRVAAFVNRDIFVCASVMACFVGGNVEGGRRLPQYIAVCM